MALVWGLFILEPEICQQYFNVEEYDDQNKPLKITNNDYYELDTNLYKVKDLSNNTNVTVFQNSNDVEKYQPLLTNEEYEQMQDNSDYFDLVSNGWKTLI
jgi:cupin superfamily acireductone dioxygenase involved in methionine salvage